jgi:ferredoxin
MIQITQQRAKCIGCNYCVEIAPERWRMNKKDGKSVLLESNNKKGFHTVEVHDMEYEANEAAARACPVRIIHLKILNR